MNLDVVGVPIPPAHAGTFKRHIVHPDLWLWDSWSYTDESGWHLYSLALSRQDMGGRAITPSQRNDFPFHIRHFFSTDQGQTWRDCGCFLEPTGDASSYYGANVWSGSMTQLESGQVVVGFTGIRRQTDERKFLQAVGYGLSEDGHSPVSISSEPVSCPLRDYTDIRDKGYYLGLRSDLGENSGEEGGPILAWRDPFCIEVEPGVLHAWWSAKVEPRVGAVAQARVLVADDGFGLDELFEPIVLPDAKDYTQAEVPKVYPCKSEGSYMMLVAACDRLFEGQPDIEVNKQLRVYRSQEMLGPWEIGSPAGSVVSEGKSVFGCSVIDQQPEGKCRMACPVTEMVAPEDQLTISIQDFGFNSTSHAARLKFTARGGDA